MTTAILNLLAVFIGGGLGSVFRYGLTLGATRIFTLPLWGTFTANMLGCLAIGFAGGLITNHTAFLSGPTRLFITVGLLGGLTTFSTLNLEALELLRLGKASWALCYLFGSALLGILLAVLGYFATAFVS